MNKKPPELPNIEDATLRACLAPLMEAMNGTAEPRAAPGYPVIVANPPDQGVADPTRGGAGSNDNPPPSDAATRDHEYIRTPKTLAEWRSLSDDDFGVFRTIELFLAMTDVELETAAAQFPRQISGTIARIGRIKRRLSDQYDIVTTAVALLERAMAGAAARRDSDPPDASLPIAGE